MEEEEPEKDHYDEEWLNGNNEEEEEEDIYNNKFECKVCLRRFKSGKALGGHKRTHNKNNDNNINHYHQYDLNDDDDVITWGATGKRGRKSTTTTTAATSITTTRTNRCSTEFVVPGMDEADMDGVLQLMLLARQNWSSSTTPTPLSITIPIPRREHTITNKSTKNLKSCPSSYQCTVCKKQFKTYQALGGHKSRHNCLLLFDLNQAPPF